MAECHANLQIPGAGGCSIWDEFTGAAAATPATQPAGSVPNAPARSTAPPSTSPNTHSTTTNPRPSPSPPHSTPTEPPSTKNGPSSPSRAPLVVPSSSATAAADHSATDTSPSSSTLPSSPPPPSPSPSSTPPPSPASDPPHQFNTGTLIAIVLSALAVALALVLVLLFFCRRRRSECGKSASSGWKRTSGESSRRRLEPHVYGGRSSRRVSSVWTGFGSVSVDPAFDSESESRRELLRARSSFGSLPVAVAGAEQPPEGSGPAGYASQAPIRVDAQDAPLVRHASLHRHRHRMHGGRRSLPHLDVRAANAWAESHVGLSQLPHSGTDCEHAAALPFEQRGGALERSASGANRAKRGPAEARGVEAF